jgi:hypothetical protein
VHLDDYLFAQALVAIADQPSGILEVFFTEGDGFDHGFRLIVSSRDLGNHGVTRAFRQQPGRQQAKREAEP